MIVKIEVVYLWKGNAKPKKPDETIYLDIDGEINPFEIARYLTMNCTEYDVRLSKYRVTKVTGISIGSIPEKFYKK